MQFQPGDHVKITNPHPENAKWRGRTGTIREIGSDGLYILRGVESRLREAVLGVIAASADELTKG